MLELTQKVLSRQNDNRVIEVNLTNKSKGLAFFINLTLKDANNQLFSRYSGMIII